MIRGIDGEASTDRSPPVIRASVGPFGRLSRLLCTVHVTVHSNRHESVAALVALCQSATQRAPVETSDSWLHHYGADEFRALLDTLTREPTIRDHLQPGQSLRVAGTNWGVGMTPAKHWLAGFLRAALPLPPDEWQREAERFAAFLAVDGGMVPCSIRTTLLGVLLASGERTELHGAALRPARLDDFSRVDAHAPLAPAVVFEYNAELPAAVAASPVAFAEDVVEDVTRAHEAVITRLLLAFAFATVGPVQTHLTMHEVPYFGGGAGSAPEDVGPIVVSSPTVLEAASIERLRDEYAGIADARLRSIGVAVRRYLMARSERVRPADQVVDYAIAIESMTKERGGEKQGKELARLLGGTPCDHAKVAHDHKAFRRARERIVHEGDIPANVKEAAALGADLVRRSLRARTGGAAGETSPPNVASRQSAPAEGRDQSRSTPSSSRQGR
jgi:hypothetical protein